MTQVDEVWVVKVISREPSVNVDGGYYLYMTIDSTSGEILASTAGGGS